MTDFAYIYQRYFKDVERYLLALCRDSSLAEELTEQVFFQALHSVTKFRGDCDIRTWLFTLAKNGYISHLRKEKHTQPIEQVYIPDPGLTLEERFADRDQAMQIHRRLHTLEEPYKEVFSLRVFSQLSFADIGVIFGRSANWACVTYHRARQKLKEKMEES